MGKTSLLMNIVEHVAIDLSMPTMVFSCEMSQRLLLERLIYSRAKVAMADLAEGWTPSDEDLKRVEDVMQEIAPTTILVDDTSAITISKLRAMARRKKREKGIGIIAIDYMQLMKAPSRQADGSHEREISDISAVIKALAKELDIPILVLSQLNRATETRTGKHFGVPRLSDLLDSGSNKMPISSGCYTVPRTMLRTAMRKKRRRGWRNSSLRRTATCALVPCR